MSVERVIFVVGLSGAGKSQTMKTLEDLNYYCIDHLPPALCEQTLSILAKGAVTQVAIGLDLRATGLLGSALEIIKNTTLEHVVLFLDARDEVLIRRYSETRRRHPLSTTVDSLRDAILLERMELAPVREYADFIIDTTDLTHSELKARLLVVTTKSTLTHQMRATVVAFGFKFGVPLDIDMLFDVRFLRNPNYVDHLRNETGLHPDVAAYIQEDPDAEVFLDRLRLLFDLLIPRFISEGKSHLTIAIGCTGGRHRSVYVAKHVTDLLASTFSLDCHLKIRDAERDS